MHSRAEQPWRPADSCSGLCAELLPAPRSHSAGDLLALGLSIAACFVGQDSLWPSMRPANFLEAPAVGFLLSGVTGLDEERPRKDGRQKIRGGSGTRARKGWKEAAGTSQRRGRGEGGEGAGRRVAQVSRSQGQFTLAAS